ncbi:MAG TPA: trehalose-6-phosphate synthase [Candidatus Limnocylindria bacterium]|nr:trehalose-6-phosphate synthase [Candidatus Limnocylindria bacterium]
MRLAVRFILPLLLAVAVVAAVALPLFDRLTSRWFVRDLDMRSAVIANAVDGPIADLLRRGDRAGVDELLAHVAQDERLFAIGVCDAQGVLVHRTDFFPTQLGCPDGARAGDAPEPVLREAGGPLHVAVHPLRTDAGNPVGRLVLLHDMAFIERRGAIARRYLFWLFMLVGALASAVTVLIAYWSRRGWIAGVRALLGGRAQAGHWSDRVAAFDLRPVAQDLRALLQEIEGDRRVRSDTQVVWTADTLRALFDQQLKGQHVLIVSNREPYIHRRRNGAIELLRPASGLVTALEPVARACAGTWVAHGSGNADRETVDARGRVAVPPEDPAYRLRRVWLTPEEEQGYYFGFANSGLWPLCHNAHVRPSFLASDWQAYQIVNQKFADAVVDEAPSRDPFVLVQDFHFALLPRLLRERLPAATIITFWHIPWPNPEAFGICPWHEDILIGMLGSSILGFHTQSHCNNFLDTVDRYLEARVDRETFTIWLGGEPTAVRRYPISIDWPPRGPALAVPVATCRRELRRRLGLAEDTRIVLGVDRLDYTKGIIERFLALERLFERDPQWIGRVVFLQVAAPSRSRIEEYHAFEERVIDLGRRINARFGRAGYEPIILKVEHHEFAQVQYLYRAADVCMVTSLHDGMNLVAKEFVAARDDEAGVLIVSQFAGASRELYEALIVNPYDIDQCATALRVALEMPVAEQRERMRSLRALVQEFNVYRWAGRMLLDGMQVRARRRVLGLTEQAQRPPAAVVPLRR